MDETTGAEKRKRMSQVGESSVTARPCPWDGGPTIKTKEGMLKCLFCLRYFQTGGFNYQILLQR